jgi:hypothetical protein
MREGEHFYIVLVLERAITPFVFLRLHILLDTF